MTGNAKGRSDTLYPGPRFGGHLNDLGSRFGIVPSRRAVVSRPVSRLFLVDVTSDPGSSTRPPLYVAVGIPGRLGHVTLSTLNLCQCRSEVSILALQCIAYPLVGLRD